ncbi:MAG: ATP-grasp domain-containing protein [Candidatus Omnitrophica bacterium]|nr:ATP-grasp domain-containing protein [Candidatus Omnitrophota bacterium]
MRKKFKILLLFDVPYLTPRGYEFKDEFFNDPDWDTEAYAYKALKSSGHQVSLLGLYNDITPLLEEVKENRPDVIFNLVEVFAQKTQLDKNVVSLLELIGIPFTGASSGTLFICNDKALSKKILSYHRIRVPRFYAFFRNHKIWLLKRLRLPLIVKPLCEEASRGISLASVVDSEAGLIERVKFIHENMNMDAIAEEYITGRELYVSMMGNKRIKILPLREMKFGKFPDDEPQIATYKAKWDNDYREKWGIKNMFAGKLPQGLEKGITDVFKRAYRVLNMGGYARFDIRVTPDARIYILEANANPSLNRDDEFSEAAKKAGIPYPKLLEKIVSYAFQRHSSV